MKVTLFLMALLLILIAGAFASSAVWEDEPSKSENYGIVAWVLGIIGVTLSGALYWGFV